MVIRYRHIIDQIVIILGSLIWYSPVFERHWHNRVHSPSFIPNRLCNLRAMRVLPTLPPQISPKADLYSLCPFYSHFLTIRIFSPNGDSFISKNSARIEEKKA